MKTRKLTEKEFKYVHYIKTNYNAHRYINIKMKELCVLVCPIQIESEHIESNAYKSERFIFKVYSNYYTSFDKKSKVLLQRIPKTNKFYLIGNLNEIKQFKDDFKEFKTNLKFKYLSDKYFVQTDLIATKIHDDIGGKIDSYLNEFQDRMYDIDQFKSKSNLKTLNNLLNDAIVNSQKHMITINKIIINFEKSFKRFIQ